VCSTPHAPTRSAYSTSRSDRSIDRPGRQFLYTDQVGGYPAPHTPARGVWAGLVGPFNVYFLFSVFCFFFFSFFFLFFLFLFCFVSFSVYFI
jgi:hypothetical protein